MEIKGLDYSAGAPTPAAVLAAGYSFVVRYVSVPGNPKNLTAAEARGMLDAGIDVAVVFERSADRTLGGAPVGAEDGAAAREQVKALGGPPRSAIYAAVDFDAQQADMPKVLAYLDAFAEACAPHPAGVYGGFRVIDQAQGRVPFLWQAGAWTQGKQHPAAHLRQFAGTITVGGISCDKNIALKPDFGGWAKAGAGAAATKEPELDKETFMQWFVEAMNKGATTPGSADWADSVDDLTRKVNTVANELRSVDAKVERIQPIDLTALAREVAPLLAAELAKQR